MMFKGLKGHLNICVDGPSVGVFFSGRVVSLASGSELFSLVEPGKYEVIDPLKIFTSLQVVPFEGDKVVLMLSPRRYSGSIVDELNWPKL